MLQAFFEAAEESMKKTVTGTIADNKGNTDISANFDGTWQKHDHSIVNEVVCATSLKNGNVIDSECLTKYFTFCWNKFIGSINCLKNYEGYSGGREVGVVIKMFECSELGKKMFIVLTLKMKS